MSAALVELARSAPPIHALWRPPRAITPGRAAVVGAGLFAAVVTPSFLFGVDDVSAYAGHGAAARVVVVALTSALAAAVGALALRSTRGGARWIAVVVGALAGAVDAWLSWAACVALGAGAPRAIGPYVGEITFAGLFFGVLYGAAIGVVARAAIGARAAPTWDGLARVLFATGAVVLAGCAAVAPFAHASPLPPTSAEAARALADAPRPFVLSLGLAIGCVLVVGAALRVGALARLEAVARSGRSARFAITPRSDHPDERALVPLVASAVAPGGVLVWRGVASAHRGERGARRLALASLTPTGAWWSRLALPVVVEALGVAGVLAASLLPFVLLALAALAAMPWGLGQG
ncbi:MAG TPA: hypothetical protein VGM56_17560 [Byssovorax sp.]|jgi:hypothetical protein